MRNRHPIKDVRVEAIDSDPAWVEAVRARLVGWYVEARRELPWRRSRDPYRILVSEMMLVQTTVAAVIPYFERFLAAFPDVRALAVASEAQVLKAWEGLGYYRRARQLHAAARQIVEDNGGIFPEDSEAIRNLPGVGRYVAGAILSFAFDQPEPIVEANSQRVLARVFAIDGELSLATTRERIWSAAGALVPSDGAGQFNQALIELGALVCTPREPSCLICPLSSLCHGRRLGIHERLPVTAAKSPPLEVKEAAVIVRRGRGVLIVERTPGGLWDQFWEFPTIHLEGANPAGRPTATVADLAAAVSRLTGIEPRIGPPIKTFKYSVTKHRVELSAHVGTASRGKANPGPGLVDARWVAPDELSTYTFSSAGRKLIEWIRSDLVSLHHDPSTAAANRGDRHPE
jgi:A/G-specific adenine glycosylase